MTKTEKLDGVVNGYKILASRLEEIYLGLTVSQIQDLNKKLEETWAIACRRTGERRQG